MGTFTHWLGVTSSYGQDPCRPGWSKYTSTGAWSYDFLVSLALGKRIMYFEMMKVRRFKDMKKCSNRV